MPFAIALSGLNAASSDLEVTANNIANANTSGFKKSRAQFAEVFAVGTQSVGSSASGSGVRLSAVAQQFTQGNIDFTDNALDLAIAGEGFFVMSENGARSYSRAGAFGVDNQGFVVNSEGARLQAYPYAGSGLFNTGTPQDLQLATGANPPAARTTASFGINLPANAAVLAMLPQDWVWVAPATRSRTKLAIAAVTKTMMMATNSLGIQATRSSMRVCSASRPRVSTVS